MQLSSSSTWAEHSHACSWVSIRPAWFRSYNYFLFVRRHYRFLYWPTLFLFHVFVVEITSDVTLLSSSSPSEIPDLLLEFRRSRLYTSNDKKYISSFAFAGRTSLCSSVYRDTFYSRSPWLKAICVESLTKSVTLLETYISTLCFVDVFRGVSIARNLIWVGINVN